MVRVVLACLLGLAVLVPAPATPAAPVVAATLDNGLRVLLLEDHRSPIVSVQIWYRVGSRNEARGATGLAHLLEHMMFKGTPRVGPGEFARRIERAGGNHNAFTSRDVTSYFVNVAADQLDLVLGLEADRLRGLLLDPRDVEAERQVVLEERRTRTDDEPAGFLGEKVSALAFRAHPYGQPIIGWADDIRGITPDDLRAFYRTYYVPGNAILVAVGAFDAGEALAAIRRHFGPIPRGPDPPPVAAVEPPQAGERRVTVRRDARLPLLYLAWHVPNHDHPDAPALELLAQVLSAGRTSRLYRHLVWERRLALDAGGDYSYFSLDPNLFWFWATPMPGQTPEALEEALVTELARLQEEPVGDEELRRAQNQIEAAFVFGQDSVHSRAALLARFELIGGHALADTFVERVRAVTAADLQRVARVWFPLDRKNVGTLLPRSGG
jgi:zinc protease